MNQENSVKCPNCKEFFKVDDSIYTDIVKQVRDQQFNEELSKQQEFSAREKESSVAAVQAQTEQKYNTLLSEKEITLSQYKIEAEKELNKELLQRENQIAQQTAQLDAAKKSEKDAIALAIATESKKHQTALAQQEQIIQTLKTQAKQELFEQIVQKDALLQKKNSQLEAAETAKTLAVQEAVSKLEKEKDNLAYDLKSKETQAQLEQSNLKEQFTLQLQAKEDEIISLRDFKQKLSTKMIGETLELHCENSFNQLRATAFQNAYFEKDNDASRGTKGDYIYREEDADGNEIISIMFEMKNENDQTASKKKNEDFFAKLDKDRQAKNCEYAVLVSLLESDNELYNNGIVDVSYKYNKMYVVRPQFFIPIITVLRNAALNAVQYKAEMSRMKNQQIDVTNFEKKIESFKTGFARNYELASKQFGTAISEIDKSISHLNKIKDALTKSENNLRLANNKADDLTIKKLTYENPTMKQRFDDLD